VSGWTGQECPRCVERALDWPEDWVSKDFAWKLVATPTVMLHWTEAGSKRAVCGEKIEADEIKKCTSCHKPSDLPDNDTGLCSDCERKENTP
jgi:hypothetical protein